MTKRTGLILFAIGIVAILFVLYQNHDAHRRDAVRLVLNVQEQLFSNDTGDVLKKIIIPPAYASRTDAEKVEFLRKALRDEMSEEGLRILMKDGEFGSLLDLFPEVGKGWAVRAGVSADECVAFRMEQNGVCVELVICTNVTPNQIVRVNNINQLVE